jgi:hypothetical protein
MRLRNELTVLHSTNYNDLNGKAFHEVVSYMKKTVNKGVAGRINVGSGSTSNLIYCPQITN